MQSFYLTYFFILGLIFGSFFNVVGLRVPMKKLFQSQRSYCPHCRHTLGWYELIPVLSYFLQLGKCRHCKKSISFLYPVIELLTGILFAYSYYVFGWNWELLVALMLCSMLIIIIVSDLTYMLIPNKILLFFLPLFIISRVLQPLEPWWSSVTGCLAGFCLVALIIVISRGGMGAGDMKLMAVIGIVLGFPSVLLAFFLSTIYGSIISVILITCKLIERKKPIPFAPFIAMGTITTYFFGEIIIEWYLTSFF